MDAYKEVLLKVFTDIEVRRNDGEDEILFTCEDGSVYRMWHEQDCCESVWIEDIEGDLADLMHEFILVFEERTETGEGTWGDTWTWTFYTIRTFSGTVVIRWNGESNGYYSESVSFERVG
jgi:hypothetical protein